MAPLIEQGGAITTFGFSDHTDWFEQSTETYDQEQAWQSGVITHYQLP